MQSFVNVPEQQYLLLLNSPVYMQLQRWIALKILKITRAILVEILCHPVMDDNVVSHNMLLPLN